HIFFFFFQAEDGIRDYKVTGVQTCALPISSTTPPTRSSGTKALPGSSSSPTAAPGSSRQGLCTAGPRRRCCAWPGRRSPRPVRRSEERRVGKECRSRWWGDHVKRKLWVGVV